MARNLSEVLHYFIPKERTHPSDPPNQHADPTPPVAETTPLGPAQSVPLDDETSAEKPEPLTMLPIVAIPIGDRDVVRAAFAWNLAVEIARLGGRARLLTPDSDGGSALWPEPGTGPLGTELIPVVANDLGSLYSRASEVAVSPNGRSKNGGIVFVRVPPAWLLKAGQGGPLLSWSLLFSCSRGNDLKEAYGLSKLILAAQPDSRVGITIHGAENRREAEAAFERLARAAEESLGHRLTSYGLLVDDLHVYRAIVAQRPIGLAHPQAPAALALRDVARLLLEDAQTRTSSHA